MATRGVYQGALVNSFEIDADNDEFTLKVDGTTSGAISLTSAVYADGDALAGHIQAQINADAALKAAGVSVAVEYDSENSKFAVSSTSFGSASSVDFISVDINTLADLGLGIGSGSAGTDIAGTINGQSAAGSGQLLTSQTGDSAGLALLIDSGSAGNRGSVSFSNGIVGTIDGLLDSFLKSDGFVSTRENGLNGKLTGLTEEFEALDTKVTNLENRLIKQFSALDALVAQFNTTSTFLEQQLDNLVKPNSAGNN